MENLRREVEHILNADESILCSYLANKTESYYFLIKKGENEFITFRVSSHPSNSFYSNRTFDITKDSNQLLKEIRDYMDNSSWYVFKYEDYFTLKVLSKIYIKNIQIYIDNTMGIFDYSIGGLVFYQCRRLGKKYKEFNIVSESFEKELRKLFASGLISSHRQGKDEILVYINRAGRFMMDSMDDKYKDNFHDDEGNIDYKYIEIPGII